jgi:hypothetical protein
LKLGLAKNRRRWDPALEGELRRLNAGGDSDSEIARKLGFERHCIHRQRKRLGLLDQSYGKQSRAAIGAGVRRQLVRLGLERLTDLRIEAWRQLARERGWPVTINGRAVNRRHVQVLDVLWERGPQTRVQLAEAIGMKVHADQKKVLASNGEGGSYLAELMRAGLVISLGRVVRTGGQGKNVHLYALDPSIEKGAEHGQRDQA